MKKIKSFLSVIRMEGRYILTGFWNTLFAYLTFILLDSLFIYAIPEYAFSYMLAMFLAQVLAILNAYFSHKYFTFRSETIGEEAFREFIRFISSHFISFLLNMSFLAVLVELFSFSPKISALFVLPFVLVINYLFLSKYTFKDALELTKPSKTTNE